MTTPVTPAPDGSVSVAATSHAKPAILGLNMSQQDPTSSGVKGQSQGGIGVWGHTDADSDQVAGFLGENSSTTNGVGVWGKGGAWAGKFDGNVLVNGSIECTGFLTLQGGATINAGIGTTAIGCNGFEYQLEDNVIEHLKQSITNLEQQLSMLADKVAKLSPG